MLKEGLTLLLDVPQFSSPYREESLERGFRPYPTYIPLPLIREGG